MRVLGIETSCDETAVAIYDATAGLLAHQLYSQTEIHACYGGVVPELASRDHIRKLAPLCKQALTEAQVTAADITGVAYTSGPGLVGALLVGAGFGRSLAWAWQVPAIGIHHLEGHLLAPMLEADAPTYPFLALLVSGGHTLLVAVRQPGAYHILGESVDDAVGEAFDKVAKLLGLGYPGGPQLARLALQGDSQRFHLPRPMTDRPGLDFSFSGLKTSALNVWRQLEPTLQNQADVAAAFEAAATDTLRLKCQRALQQTGLKRLIVAGGVGANQVLRHKLTALAQELSVQVYYPRPEFCTDNAAMIAYAGLQRLRAGNAEPLAFRAVPRWSLAELPALSTDRI